MFNVYPWGVSVNVVKPQAVDRTKVSFTTYVVGSVAIDRVPEPRWTASSARTK